MAQRSLHPYHRRVSVTCATCGTEGPQGAKFCMECGAKLALTCPDCATELPDGAKFCLECGVPVGSAATAKPQTPPPSADEEPASVDAAEERRIITALFTDLAGFTSHTESVDPEDAGERLTLYHRLVREEIERYDGRIEKLLGDGVFAVFGAPTAHEDDPERAVRAALRIQEGVERLNEEHPGIGLAVRVGITTGEAVVQLDRARKDKVGIVGDVVNTASRLEGVAPVGGVVVDERTFLAANPMIDFKALPPVELKGKATPVTIWQPTAPKSRYGIAIEELAETPFVGREAELRLLVDTFDRVLSEETTQLVTMVGEPGVGKSRLMQEFWKVVDGRSDVVWWRQGRCLPLGEGITFWAIGEVVKAQAGIYDSDPPWQAQQKLRDSVRALVDDHTEADWILSRLAPLAGTDESESAAERAELFNAWLRYFEALSARNPLVLVIEDLHWADDALVEFLEHLIDQTVGSPILLITTARPQLLRERPTWGAGRVNAASIGLSPLGNDDTKRLLAGLLPGRLMTAEAQQRLLEQCGGIPLYATEFVRLIEEQGSAERIDELVLPDSIQAITAARLDLLDRDDRQVLQTAAVVGKVFWSGAIASIMPVSRDDIRAALRRLAQRDLIRPIKKSSIEGENEWTFAHALIRDVAYGRLSRADRALRHEEIGRWIEATSGDRMTDVAEVLAYHFGEAIRLQSEPGEELRTRAHAALMAAGTRTKHLDVKRAIAFYRQAADAALNEGDRGLALIEAGGCAATREEMEEFGHAAEAIFLRLGDVENQARARGLIGTALWIRGETEEAEAHLAVTLDLIEDRLESAVGAGSLLHKASILWRTGRAAESEMVIEQARPIVERYGDAQARMYLLHIHAGNRLAMGDISGMEVTQQVLDMALDRGESTRAASSYNNLATHLVFFEHVDKVLATIDEGIEFCKTRGLQAFEEWSRMTRFESLLPLGRFQEILDEIDALREVVDEDSQTWIGLHGWMTWSRYFMGLPLSVVPEFFDEAERITDPQIRGPIRVAKALKRHEEGLRDEATAAAETILDAFEGDEQLLALNGPIVAEVLLDLGRLDILKDITIPIESQWRYQTALRHRSQGLIAEAEGRLDDAVDSFRTGIAIAESLGHRFNVAWTGVPLARVLGALDREAEQVAILDRVEPLSLQMGTRPLTDEIARLRGADDLAEAN